MRSDSYSNKRTTSSKPGSSDRPKSGKPGGTRYGKSGYNKSGSDKSGNGRSRKAVKPGSGAYSYKRIEREKQLPPDPAEIRDILGIVSAFRISKLTPIGAYLSPISNTPETDKATNKDSEFTEVSEATETAKVGRISGNFEILLPKNEMTGHEFRRGSIVEAYLYLDSEDRPIATLNAPALSIGGLALLKCSETTQMGAFLDWGLMKELFLPFKEQTYRVKKGDNVLVTLYLDKSSRLCASMKIYKLLKTDSPYNANDHVEGFVYELSEEHGAYVAVDNIYSALIPKRELVKKVKIGETLNLRVSKVLADGKLELAMREQSHLQLSDDCDIIYNELKASTKGFLPYHDKTESLIIKNKFNMSKIAFKRAIGHLYKQGLITIKEDGIYLSE